jgi:1-acyl-sn-glycerol-3-phosphate acyltransferase
MASRPLYKLWGYEAVKVLCQLGGVLGFGIRVFGRNHAPRSGAALVCSNHQSHFDPVLIGLSLESRLNYLARRTLFDVPVLRPVMEYFDAIPIDREGPALGGIKETLKRLKRDEQVLIFPEGTRTRDGEVAPLKPGFTTLARRAEAPILPIGFDGAYQAWPRTQTLPGLSQIVIVIDRPIMPAEFEALSDEELVAEVERRIRTCHAQARAYRKRSWKPEA